jgi:hypothetical protein
MPQADDDAKRSFAEEWRACLKPTTMQSAALLRSGAHASSRRRCKAKR